MGVRFVQSGSERERGLDALVLLVIVALSALPYVSQLGFYSDDWDLMSGFEAARRSGHSVIGANLARFDVRPVQAVYLALLHGAFGLRPLGYHLVNTAVIAASTLLLYLLLPRLRVSRGEAFAAALIFALVPLLSTVRVWASAFQIPLSLLFALVAMHSLLSFDRSRRAIWAAIAVISTGLSLGAYEIFTPVIAGFALMVLVRVARERPSMGRMAGPAAVLAAVALGVVLKLLTHRSDELADPGDLLHTIHVFLTPYYDWRVGYGLNPFAALDIYFWHSIRGWGDALVRLATGRASAPVSVIAVATASLVWWRMRSAPPHEWRPSRLLILGLAAFILGHATFLVSNSIMFAPTGIGNRVLVAGAVGAAMILAGLAALVASAAPERLRTIVLASMISTVAAGAVVRLALIERYWAQAPDLQRQVIDAARRDLAALPEGSTVILDGVCPYHGPAIVFETSWDVAGALSVALNRKIDGDAVSPRMTLTKSGLDTGIYLDRKHYPFGPKLFAYDPGRHLVVALTDVATTRRYFARPSPRCPKGYVGQGVLV